LLALDDEFVKATLPSGATPWLMRRCGPGGEFSAHISRWLTRHFQAAMEREHRLLRQELLSRDVYLGDLLAFSGRQE
jgi:hypothetical protein